MAALDAREALPGWQPALLPVQRMGTFRLGASRRWYARFTAARLLVSMPTVARRAPVTAPLAVVSEPAGGAALEAAIPPDEAPTATDKAISAMASAWT